MIFVFLCLTYFTQYDNLQVHPCCCKWHYFILFLRLSNIPLHLLYPFICRWTFRLLPCLGYCKQCCNEHWGACIFLKYGFLRIYAQEWDCWIMWQLYFQFFKEQLYCSPQWLYQFTFPPTAQEGSLFSTPSLAFVVYRLFFFFFWPHCAACRILVPQPGIEPTPPAVEAQKLNHWTAREVPVDTF